MPKSVKLKQHGVGLTRQKTILRNAELVASRDGKVMATCKVAFDLWFLLWNREKNVFVHWEEAPAEKGWYGIDRKSRTLIRISEERAKELKWHDKLEVWDSALDAVNKKQPLLFGLDTYYYKSGLYLMDQPHALERIYAVQVDPSHEAAPSLISQIMRREKELQSEPGIFGKPFGELKGTIVINFK